MGRKSNLRNRPSLAPKDAVTVRCRKCAKRIAILWTTGVVPHRGATHDGHWLDGVHIQFGSILEDTKGPTCSNGIKDLLNEDWFSITCKRCGHNEQLRDRYLHALLAGSPGGDVRLGDHPRPDPSDAGAWAW
ncbi:hypothetical protein BH23ACT2_BH23ACT2_01560 [soil metagenome]